MILFKYDSVSCFLKRNPVYFTFKRFVSELWSFGSSDESLLVSSSGNGSNPSNLMSSVELFSMSNQSSLLVVLNNLSVYFDLKRVFLMI